MSRDLDIPNNIFADCVAKLYESVNTFQGGLKQCEDVLSALRTVCQMHRDCKEMTCKNVNAFIASVNIADDMLKAWSVRCLDGTVLCFSDEIVNASSFMCRSARRLHGEYHRIVDGRPRC